MLVSNIIVVLQVAMSKKRNTLLTRNQWGFNLSSVPCLTERSYGGYIPKNIAIAIDCAPNTFDGFFFFVRTMRYCFFQIGMPSGDSLKTYRYGSRILLMQNLKPCC